MQMFWNKNTKRAKTLPPCPQNLPFQTEDEDEHNISSNLFPNSKSNEENLQLSQQFQSQGNSLAEEGKYGDALKKWEAAITLTPGRAVLHEQKAQILLEIGESWKALQAASRATELDSSWAEAWVTLARAQLNFGEPELCIQSTKKAIELKPDCKDDVRDDLEAAKRLIANRKRLEQEGSHSSEIRSMVRGSRTVFDSSGNISDQPYDLEENLRHLSSENKENS